MATFNIVSNSVIYRNDNPTFSLTGSEINRLIWYYRITTSGTGSEVPLAEVLTASDGDLLASDEQLFVFLSSTISENTYSLNYQFNTSEVPLKQWYEIGYRMNGSVSTTWTSTKLYIYQAPSIAAPIINLETQLNPRSETDRAQYIKYYTPGALGFSWTYPSLSTLPDGWGLQYEIRYIIGNGTTSTSYGTGNILSSGSLGLSHLTLGNPGNIIKFQVIVTSQNDSNLKLISNNSNTLIMLQDFTYEGGLANISFNCEEYGSRARAGVNLRPNYYHRYINSSLQHPTNYTAITVSTEHPRYAESELGYHDFNYSIALRKVGTSQDIILVDNQPITDLNVSRITNLILKYDILDANQNEKWTQIFGVLDKSYITSLVLIIKDIYGRIKKEEILITIDFREAPFEIDSTNKGLKLGRNPIKNDGNHLAASNLGYFPTNDNDTDLRLIVSDEYFVIGFNKQSLASYYGDLQANRQYNFRILQSSNNSDYSILTQIKNITNPQLEAGAKYGLSGNNAAAYAIKATNLTNGYYYKAEIQVQDSYDASYPDITSSFVSSTTPVLKGYNAEDLRIQITSTPRIEELESQRKIIVNFLNEDLSQKTSITYPAVENTSIYGYERVVSGYTKNITLTPQYSIDMETWQDWSDLTSSGKYYEVSLPTTEQFSYNTKPSVLYIRIKMSYARRLEVYNNIIKTETSETYSNVVIIYLNIATVAYRQNEIGINTTADLTSNNVVVIKDHESHKNLVLSGNTTIDGQIKNTLVTYNLGTGELNVDGEHSLLFATTSDIYDIFT